MITILKALAVLPFFAFADDIMVSSSQKMTKPSIAPLVLVTIRKPRNGCKRAECGGDADVDGPPNDAESDPELERMMRDLGDLDRSIDALTGRIQDIYSATLEPLDRERYELNQRLTSAQAEIIGLRSILSEGRSPPLSDEIRANLQNALLAAIEDEENINEGLRNNSSERNTEEVERAVTEIITAERARDRWETQRNLAVAQLAEHQNNLRINEINERDPNFRNSFGFYVERATDAVYLARIDLELLLDNPQATEAKISEAEAALNRAEHREQSLRVLVQDKGSDATFDGVRADLSRFLDYTPPVIQLDPDADAATLDEARSALALEQLRSAAVLNVLTEVRADILDEMGAIELDKEDLRLEMRGAKSDGESLALAGLVFALSRQTERLDALSDRLTQKIDEVNAALVGYIEGAHPSLLSAIGEVSQEAIARNLDLAAALGDQVLAQIEAEFVGPVQVGIEPDESDATMQALQDEILRLERFLDSDDDLALEDLALPEDTGELIDLLIDARSGINNLLLVREAQLNIDLDEALEDEDDLARAEALTAELEDLSTLIARNWSRLRDLSRLSEIWPS